MKSESPFIRTGNAIGPTGQSAVEIDSLLSELCRLYLERFKVMRTGDHHDLQKITHQISAIKTKLKQL